MDAPSVDLVVNVFERTYREVLVPGWFDDIARLNEHTFVRRVVLLNNVDDSRDALARAEVLLASGELTHCYSVATELPRALARVGLRERDLQPLPHFSDCALVAVALDGSDFVVYWDADVRLRRSVDWVTPSIDLMARYQRVVVANPSWDAAEAVNESSHVTGDFVIGYGFSDLVFLFRRSDFAPQNYRRSVPASWRYPLAHVVPVFEQRVDSWMRRERLLRATYLPATIEHRGPVGTAYPPPTPRQRVRRRLQEVAGPFLKRWRAGDPRYEAYGLDDRPLV